MARPFYERLRRYYGDVAAALRGEADAASIFPNGTDVGVSREQLYATFLKLHLPSSCNVALGGFLFNQDGEESRQVDVLVTSDTCPRYDFHNRDGSGKTFACVDGTLAVASLKSGLDSAELADALGNLASVPSKLQLGPRRVNPMVSVPDYDAWPVKIVYAARGGVSSQTAMEALAAYYTANPDIPHASRPDLIHVAGAYVIAKHRAEGDATGHPLGGPGWFYSTTEDDADVVGLSLAVHRVQKLCQSVPQVLFSYDAILHNLLRPVP